MKNFKITLAIVVMLSLAPAIYAGGIVESTQQFKVDSSTLGIFRINQEGDANQTKLIFNHPSKGNSFGLYRVTYEDGTISYYSMRNGVELRSSLTNWDQFFTAETLTEDPITVEYESLTENTTDIKTAKNSYSSGLIQTMEGLYGEGKVNKIELESKAVIAVENRGGISFVEALIVDAEDQTSYRMEYRSVSDFFRDENEFFSNPTNSQYEKVALAFLGSMLPEDFKTDFDSLNTGYTSAQINWTQFEYASNDTSSIRLLKERQQSFKWSLNQRLVSKDGDKEYLEYTDALRDAIYNPERRNIYISTYLKYLEKVNKPLMSALFVDEYIRHNQLNDQEQLFYDYTKYEPVPEIDGVAPLARNALRYFTWGVDYTPFSGYNTLLTATGNSEVWSLVYDQAYFENWLDPDGPEGPRGNNYATVAEEFSPGKPKSNIVYSSNAADTITLKSHESGTEIFRVDVWSAKNLAWEPVVKNPLLYECLVDENGNLTTSVNSGLAALDPNRMQDERLYLDASADSSENNLLVKREEVNDNGIGVGYEFKTPQKVKALMVVKGYSPPNVGTSVKMDAAEEYISLFYWDTDKNDWTKLQASEYIECVENTAANHYSIYPGTGEFKPGDGLWDDWASNNNSEMVHSYFILNSAIDTDKILLVDNSDNTLLNVSEMGVFSDDPLKFFDVEGTEIVYGADNTQTQKIYWTETDFDSGNIKITNGSSSDITSLYNNGNPSLTYTFNGTDSYITLKGKANASIQQVVAWGPADENSSVFSKNNAIAAVFDPNLGNSEYFYALPNHFEDNWSNLAQNVDTPFVDGSGDALLGNPLPYAPSGIDSPRTFAYKMGQQSLVNGMYGYRTTAANGNYLDGYKGPEDGLSSTAKPFQPGYYLNTTVGYNQTVKTEMSAGVDSAGLLQGVLAMLEGYDFVGAGGESLTEGVDGYYAMAESDAPGLDNSKTPVFYADSNNSLDNLSRITTEDLERSTVIVPDIRDIQEGDILVNADSDGKLHIGIVVGFLTETRPATFVDPAEWWSNVLVVSVRPGFQTVTLGTWGNNGSLFGGFSEHPEKYLIRRPLVKSSDALELSNTVASHELLERVHEQRYTHYVEEGLVPYTAETVIDDFESTAYRKFTEKQTAGYPESTSAKAGIAYEELPPTSYTTNRVNVSIFDGDIDDGVIIEMLPTSFTGWREVDKNADGTIDYIGYHRGLDVVPAGWSSMNVGEQSDEAIYAPEGGKFWVIDLVENVQYKDNIYVQIDEDNYIILETFSEGTYGDISVLVTNPGNPRLGRIYLFMHQYVEYTNNKGLAYYYENTLQNKYVDEDGTLLASLPDFNNQAIIPAGNWIGFVGGNGGVKPHGHFEVFEFFPEYNAVSKKVGSQSFALLADSIEDKNGCNRPPENIVESSIGWQRIDPRTVFAQSVFLQNTAASEFEALKTELCNDAHWAEPSATEKEKLFERLFQKWLFWAKITEE